MRKYGLIGSSLAHSQSRRIHALIGNYDYNMIETDSDQELKEILADTEYSGFNITSPFQVKVTEYLDELSPDAAKTGSVDLVKRLPDGRLKGFNTLTDGFRYSIKGLARYKKCVILGTGGAARSCAEALKELGADRIVLVSRDPEAASARTGDKYEITGYSKLHPYYDADILINATPVGQYPELERSPAAEQRMMLRMFSELELAGDMIYNPYRSKFLQDARRLTRCRTKSGLEMLIFQSVRSKDIWMDTGTDDEELLRLIRLIKHKLLEVQLNIVAVGMPGSGKTTIFRRYAYEKGLKFIDTDEETDRLSGCAAAELLSSGESGIEYYRAMENIAVQEISRSCGAVIATGGGTLLNPINRDLLRSNGVIIYVKRPVDMLDIKGRPLSINIGVRELFSERDRIYRRVADMSILNARIFGGNRKANGKGNTYNYELKGFVYYIARKIEKYLNDIADNIWI